MSPILTTERLQLQPCNESDVAFLHALWTSDRMRYYLFDDRIITIDEARSFVETSLDSFEQNHYGLWLVYLQEQVHLQKQMHFPEQCIGFAGFMETEEAPNLIYGFHSNFWGQGYATEAARAVLDYGLKTLNLTKVNADVDEPNIASVRVLQKLGMQQVNRVIVNHHPLLYFTIDTAHPT